MTGLACLALGTNQREDLGGGVNPGRRRRKGKEEAHNESWMTVVRSPAASSSSGASGFKANGKDATKLVPFGNGISKTGRSGKRNGIGRTGRDYRREDVDVSRKNNEMNAENGQPDHEDLRRHKRAGRNRMLKSRRLSG